jgi:hypothetical protein
VKSKKERAGAEREVLLEKAGTGRESSSRGWARERERAKGSGEAWVTNWKMVYGKKIRKPFSVFY